jgi:uncharacterized membrane protein
MPQRDPLMNDQIVDIDENIAENEGFPEHIPSINLESVYFDEISEIQSRLDRIQNESQQREEEEKSRKLNCNRRYKMAVIMVACVVLGGIIGAVISTSRLYREGKAVENILLQNTSNTREPSFVAATASPSATPSQSPSLSSHPSLAPSCVAKFRFMESVFTSEINFQKFEISGSGYVSLGLFGSRYSNYTQFLEFIYNQATGIFLTKSTRLRLAFDITTIILSHYGDKMIIGAGGYKDPLTTVGGAVIVFRQLNGEWKEMYRTGTITPGEFTGRVTSLASDTNVSNIAVIAGVDDPSDFPWFARVFTIPNEPSMYLIGKGQKILVSKNSQVGLSSDGRRFLLYDYDNENLMVMEFDQVSNIWNKIYNINMSDISKVDEMQVSMNGQSVLVISNAESGNPKPFVYRNEGNKWIQFPLKIDSQGKMIFHIYGAISETRTTASITISWVDQIERTQKSGSFIFQMHALGFVKTEFLSFPESAFLHEGRINSQGNLLVVSGSESLKVFRSTC